MKACLMVVLMAALTLGGPASLGAQADGAARILHLPPPQHQAEQGILTSIPMVVSIPDAIDPERVLVHYKIRGAESWTTLELTRTRDGWGGAIPCLEVSTITGHVLYYIRVHNREGRVVAYSGTRHSPYRVLIVHDSAMSEATLDRPRCPDPADCPRGLPGCPSEVIEKIPCASDADCEGDATCAWDGYCELNARQHTWVELSGSQEFGVIDTSGACSLDSQENEGTLCRRQFDDSIYYGPMAHTNEPLKLGLGNTRIWLGIERLLSYTTSVKVRAGFAALGKGPTAPGGVPFVPFSAELSLAHWFGSDPFRDPGFRPFVTLGVGYGMFDIQSSTHVRADVTRYDPQGGNDLDQTVDLWKRAGDGFVSLGGGVVLASRSGWAVAAEMALSKSFPFSALILAPRLGVKKGF